MNWGCPSLRAPLLIRSPHVPSLPISLHVPDSHAKVRSCVQDFLSLRFITPKDSTVEGDVKRSEAKFYVVKV